MRLAIAALLVGALAGCSEGSYGEQEKWVKGDLARYFAELNADGGARAQEAKATDKDSEIPDTSLVIDRYDWSAEGSIFVNIECPNGACKAKIGTLATFSAEERPRCPACNQDVSAEGANKGRPMFEVKSTAAPLVVVVRFIHRSMALDSSSAVMVSSKTEQTAPIKPWTEARAPGLYYAGGFYREVHSTLGASGFVYRGGSLSPVDRESTKKLTAEPAETVSPSSMKTRGWDPAEEPIFRWLGRAPSAKPKEEKKAD